MHQFPLIWCKNVEVLESGEFVSGQIRPILFKKKLRGKKLCCWQSLRCLEVVQLLIGEARKKSYVKSVFHGAYKREVFDNVGGFDEQLGRTEQ